MILGAQAATPAPRVAYRPCPACLVNIAQTHHEPRSETCRELGAERSARFHPLDPGAE